MKRITILMLAALMLFFTGCSGDFAGLFGLTKPKEESVQQAQTEQVDNIDKYAEIQDALEKWCIKYDSFTSSMAEKYPVAKVIAPSTYEKLPDAIVRFVDKYILQEEATPETTENIGGPDGKR